MKRTLRLLGLLLMLACFTLVATGCCSMPGSCGPCGAASYAPAPCAPAPYAPAPMVPYGGGGG